MRVREWLIVMVVLVLCVVGLVSCAALSGGSQGTTNDATALNPLIAHLDAWLGNHGITPEGAASAGDAAKNAAPLLPAPLNTIGWILGTIVTGLAGWWAAWRKNAAANLATAAANGLQAALKSMTDGVDAALPNLSDGSAATLKQALYQTQLLQGTRETVQEVRGKDPAITPAAASAGPLAIATSSA